MPFRIGPTELIILLVIVMIIFGVGKLPQIGGAMGKAIRGFRKGVSGEAEEAFQVDVGNSKKGHQKKRSASDEGI